MIKNLICLEGNIINVIRFQSNKLEFIKKDGEKDIPITEDFWDWWGNIVSYIEDDAVDICLVYDKENELFQENDILKGNIINSDASVWKIEHIQQYFYELKTRYTQICIISPEGERYELLGGSEEKEFQTNLNFRSDQKVSKKAAKDESIESIAKDESIESIAEEEYTDFAKYFINLNRKERN